MAKNQAFVEAFGRNLKKIIDDLKKTPEDVAAHGDIETKQVYRVINGEHSSGLNTIYALAKGLGVAPKVLFDFDFKYDFKLEDDSK
jgi:predicted transcriptional regulator